MNYAMDILIILGNALKKILLYKVLKLTRLIKTLTKRNTTNMPTRKELFLLMKWVSNAE